MRLVGFPRIFLGNIRLKNRSWGVRRMLDDSSKLSLAILHEERNRLILDGKQFF